MPRIRLIEDLTSSPVPAGSSLLVEFDPVSQWYNASCTIAAGWLRTGGTVRYYTLAQPPDEIRWRLQRLGLDFEQLEREDKLRIVDIYTLTLGQKSKEKHSFSTLKVADMSIDQAQELRSPQSYPNQAAANLGLNHIDNVSVYDRFNSEKSWVDYYLTRLIPTARIRKDTFIRGILTGVHSDWVYKQLEAAHDGVLDFKLEEKGEDNRNLVRIRGMRNVRFDSRWHPVTIGEDLEITLQK